MAKLWAFAPVIIFSAVVVLIIACGSENTEEFSCDNGFTAVTESNNITKCVRNDIMCDRRAEECIAGCGNNMSMVACPTYCEEEADLQIEREDPATATARLDQYRSCCDLYFVLSDCPDCSACSSNGVDSQCFDGCLFDKDKCSDFSNSKAASEACRVDCLVTRAACRLLVFDRTWSGSDKSRFQSDGSFVLLGIPFNKSSSAGKDSGTDEDSASENGDSD